jgi:hypothetical protein
MLPITVTRDLTVVVGDESTRLTPSQAFQLAERLIRRSTQRLVAEEVAANTVSPPKRAGKESR